VCRIPYLWSLGLPQYPFCIEENRHDVPMEDCLYARPQLFFTCVLQPKDERLPKNRTYKTGPDDIVYTLVFFSTFEELKLPIKGSMEDAGGIKLSRYEPSPTYSGTASMWPMSRLYIHGTKPPSGDPAVAHTTRALAPPLP
jgi:hypothetical protein